MYHGPSFYQLEDIFPKCCAQIPVRNKTKTFLTEVYKLQKVSCRPQSQWLTAEVAVWRQELDNMFSLKQASSWVWNLHYSFPPKMSYVPITQYRVRTVVKRALSVVLQRLWSWLIGPQMPPLFFFKRMLLFWGIWCRRSSFVPIPKRHLKYSYEPQNNAAWPFPPR